MHNNKQWMKLNETKPGNHGEVEFRAMTSIPNAQKANLSNGHISQILCWKQAYCLAQEPGKINQENIHFFLKNENINTIFN